MFSWIIENIIGSIPVWAWTALAGAGVAAYFISGLIGKMPLAQAKVLSLITKVGGIAAVLVGVFMCGGAGVTAVMQDDIKEMQDKVAKAEAESADANKQLKAAFEEKTGAIHNNQKVVQEKIKQDASKMDSSCTVDSIAIDDLNQAAGGKKK
jgi:FtsZ-binding cell division protein ZapB